MLEQAGCGAALLPSAFESLRGRPRKHTFVFAGFAAEEEGMVGSRFYVSRLSPEQKARIRAMLNMDSLGLSPTKVWVHASNKILTEYLVRVARAMNSSISGMNVENVGSSDSQSFAEKDIPVVDIHSVTQQTSPKPAGYLAFLDTMLE